VLEPSPRRPSRARGARPLARLAALITSAVLALGLSVPAALALGEDGPFPFPAETTTLRMIPGSVTRIPLRSLVEDGLEDQVDLDSARLALPADLSDAIGSRMVLGEDSRSIEIEGEGTWTLLGQELVFTPQVGVDAPTLPIALTVGGHHDSRSLPVTLTPEPLDLEETLVHGPADATSTSALGGPVPEGGSVRLELAGLPAGSTMLADGSRAIVPDQGAWQLSEDGASLAHTPSGQGLGRQLDPIRYVIADDEGAVIRAGRVTLTVPIISDLDWSAPYGEDILFVVGEGQQYVDPTTLRLVPLGEQGSFTASQDGTRVIVEGQGVWLLDRDEATVRFTPESAEVRETAPMGITGADDEGNTASTALLSTAYPILRSRAESGPPGRPLSLDMTNGIRDVDPDSLRFNPEAAPEGAEISDDGLELTVPGEGAWQIDTAGGAVIMTPEDGVTGAVTPVGVAARGVYADNPATATLEAVFSPVAATLRDDEGRAAPGSTVTVDVLGNDTAGSSSQPLVPETVRISSLAATNISELEDGRGTRLILPEEGTFTVGANGAVTFVPADGFVGRTSPVTYEVRDSAGVPYSATLVVDVDPDHAVAGDASNDVSGINSLLIGLMPSSPGTASLFGTIVVLLLFSGSVSFWISLRMEADRRAWED